MFSTDRNIETIGQLVQLVKHYIGLQKEYVKLDIIEKTVRLITAMFMFVIALVIVFAVLTYASFAALFAMASTLGYPWAFGIIAAFYLVVLVLFLIFRHKCIERPLVRFLASLLMEK